MNVAAMSLRSSNRMTIKNIWTEARKNFCHEDVSIGANMRDIS